MLEDNLHAIPLNSEDLERFILDLFKGSAIPADIQSELDTNHSDEERRIIYGYMSTPLRDAQGEILNPMGMDGHYWDIKGRIKYEHEAKSANLKGAEQIIGAPIIYRQTEKGNLYIAELFPASANKPVVDELWNTLKAIERSPHQPKFGVSVEGKYEQRHGDRVNKWLVINLVVTPNPVNIEAEINILKSMTEDIEKTLTASPVPSNFQDREGGNTLQTENTNNEHAKRRHKVEKKKGKRARTQDEARKFLTDQGESEEFIGKCLKAMFDDEDIASEENADIKTEEGIGDKEDKKTKKSLSGDDMATMITDMTKGLGDAITELQKSVTAEVEVEPEVEPDLSDEFELDEEIDDGYDRVSKSVSILAKGVDKNSAINKSLVDANVTLLKGNQTLLKLYNSQNAEMDEIKKSLKLLAKSSDGVAGLILHNPEAKKTSKTTTDSTYMNKSLAAESAVNAGAITIDQWKSYKKALSSNDPIGLYPDFTKVESLIQTSLY